MIEIYRLRCQSALFCIYLLCIDSDSLLGILALPQDSKVHLQCSVGIAMKYNFTLSLVANESVSHCPAPWGVA